ncbi:MAG TPA: methionyl-tRNA formyltransferase [bacterium]|nr:methionyl-tRNA formyltransferase [bacterium]
MRIIFMGTPKFALPTLQTLLSSVVGVITQPDRPQGRGYRLQPPVVKEVAFAAGIPVLQPQQVDTAESLSQILQLAPDLIVVVAYGQILPLKLLALPPKGCINLHASLLPRWRGAAPIERSIMHGDEITGVTTMYMSAGLDTGDIIMQEEEIITADDTAASLAERLAEKGADLVKRTVRAIIAGTAPRQPQDHSLATWAPPLTKEDAIVNWQQSANMVANQVRGLNPRPGATTFVAGDRLKIWQAKASNSTRAGQPGRILEVRAEDGIVVACGQGALLIEKVQPAGKRSMTAQSYACGYRVQPGDIWG